MLLYALIKINVNSNVSVKITFELRTFISMKIFSASK